MEHTNMIFMLVTSTYLLSYILLFTHSVRFATTAAFSFTNETDLRALLAIKDLVQVDPFHVLSSWNDSLHFCNWHGVGCANKHQRVTALNMSTLGLAGSLSPHIGNLTFLKEINFEDNHFHGNIPQEIGRLFRLQFLLFANNSFQGEFPINLTNCSELRVVDLRGNNLEGIIPSELSTLANLYRLRLDRNYFSGKIPPFLGNLSSLRILGLSKNNVDGTIPSELGLLSNLEAIFLSSNRLSGMVPPQLYNISSIQTFSITNNVLSGEFPSNIGLTLPNLQLFLADLNQFFGFIPASLANASGLIKISIGDNNFSGPAPLNLGSLQNLEVLHFGHNPLGTSKANDINTFISSITNCTNLIVLSLSRTLLGGVLPTSIGNLSTKLTSMWLDENNITGGIPPEIGNLVNLQYLTMDTNMITGIIPDSIGKLTKLQELHLFTNNISGKISSSIGNITGLGILRLEENMLDGSIPVSLANCSNLKELHLASNHLTGAIPEHVIGLSSLSIGFSLAQNYLVGSFPSQVGNMQNLMKLDISENKLSGDIPSSLGDCLMLESLHMEGNSFEGTIPSSLRQLKSIHVMDLSRNNLSGGIPNSLGELTLLGYLNLSFNMFEGEVPNEGVFSNISDFSVTGNEMLCGGIAQLKLPACPTDVTSRRRKLPARTVVILATTVPLFTVAVLVSVCVIYRTRQTRQVPSTTSVEGDQYPKLSYKELHRSTNGFSSANLIGSGRYGSVYKGILGSSEQTVAVKVLNLQEHGANKSFLAECEALRNLRHRNLVKITTSCSSLDFKGNDFKALVFEFMKNGSLESWLHPTSAEHYDSMNLNLIQRLNIAIDVASALDYLHNHCDTPVTHCDLKPSNILLDDDLCAHVGDFGLARFLLSTRGKSNHAESSSIGVRGTVGYVAPEYGVGGEIWTLGDVYSYGILLLEMFTGKRPTDSMYGDNSSLHNYAKMALPHRVTEIVDPLLLNDEESDETNQINKEMVVRIEECMTSILQIGISCSAEIPSERTDIKNALTQLRVIRNVYIEGKNECGQRNGRNVIKIDS